MFGMALCLTVRLCLPLCQRSASLLVGFEGCHSTRGDPTVVISSSGGFHTDLFLACSTISSNENRQPAPAKSENPYSRSKAKNETADANGIKIQTGNSFRNKSSGEKPLQYPSMPIRTRTSCGDF